MNPTYWVCYNFSKLIAKVLFRFRAIHQERLIESGPAIFAMNHESYLDPPFAGIGVTRAVYFLARKSLLNLPLLGWLLPRLNVIPVDQEGGDRSALKILIRLLKAGHCTVVFPEGGRTLDGNLQPAQPGLGLIVARTLAPVVPMRIFGARQAWPRGSSRIRLSRITVVVGEPIYFTPEDVAPGGKETYQRISQRVMDAIAAIRLEE